MSTKESNTRPTLQKLRVNISLSDSITTLNVFTFLEVVCGLSEVDDGGRGGVGGGGGHPDDAYEGATSNTCSCASSFRSCTSEIALH